ncbi:NADPH-dependent FMN reductase [Halarchaeum acidiphilum MH1-52-1]|uniref:NADPH-dependent FMN reductase n=1 Tax=Halarchaeum acidiphilum MH1-52-1 TaxID=1261545 RepID=U2YEE9_9EURY|nr:NAD(P)H-dependent oxidoreductase [Halarchaeum acidiphilum]GAD52166.1 NADPH-dependent FMN reductase [Halarchaeum acidiphilum MH1-52-1]
MTDGPLIVGVAGSRRDGSHTRTAVERVLDACETAGAETDLLALGDVSLPLYHPDREADERGEAAALIARVEAADGVVFGSPVYHGTISSTLKNFHDYCGYDEYEDTAIGLLAVAGGASYGATLEHMRATIRSVHGNCIPEQLGIANVDGAFDDRGAFADESLAERATAFAESLVARADRTRSADAATLADPADD